MTRFAAFSSHPSIAGFCVALSGLAPCALADVPTYRVEVIHEFDITMTIRNASESGHVVGWMVSTGNVLPFIAQQGTGAAQLPLPTGYQSGTAMDVNSHGVVVGAVATNGFPFDGGQPAIWMPDGMGGYTVVLPQQFTQMPSPLGTLSINGGMATSINEAGQIVGWSRYQGFQGGPATQFFASGPPVDLKAHGFEATPEDLNEVGVAVGNGLRFDLNTMTATPLGLPLSTDGVSITAVYAYSINDHNQVVTAARRATSTADRWTTYIHDGEGAWSAHNPFVITPNVGFYDNNNRGDVFATGGARFMPENVLVSTLDSLLRPEDTHWDVGLGFVTNDRTVYTTAFDSAAQRNAIVALIPIGEPCPGDIADDFGTLGGDGQVSFGDFLALLALVGPCPGGTPGCTGDIADDFGTPGGDGMVSFGDFLRLLALVGPCP